MLELDDPISAGTGYYLAAALGDMGGATDLADDIARARELATTVRDVSLLSRLLLLDARVQERTGDERGRAQLALAVAELERQGGIRAAALARRDLALVAMAAGRPAEARGRVAACGAGARAPRRERCPARTRRSGAAWRKMPATPISPVDSRRGRSNARPANDPRPSRTNRVSPSCWPGSHPRRSSDPLDDDELFDRCERLVL